ncbi:acyltransferase family protein [Microbacterium sp. JZ37]|uniref:acyltransferase family protein n=1 Tax=Microbacterium sp. JZ37 TaxID=2654193 RepID=UPI002B476F50|nr:acyltransferase family protein [Microbacterium sp. JZ37]WRH16902.1 acyltransferase family protein [Microbacterium sp. JZ37]
MTTRTPARADIQALRALAVLGVVLFHIWPRALPGGYAGVDVFFVISGFLITGQLVRARERGTLRLGAFWAARARRLLPASLLVLLASVVLVLVWTPAPQQAHDLRSIVASALYAVNWQLAADGVDYLAHDAAPPIAQHYWSLAVEEQFYLLWPLLVLAATARRLRGRRLLVAGVVAVAVVGFAVSVWLTGASYPYGYFSTASRLWEFALGAIVALLPPLALRASVRLAIWVAAVAALVMAMLVFDAATAFPGPWALVPTAATALLIAIGPTAPAHALERLVAWRPVQWVGDQSYGVYLWHWPLVVIAPHVLGRAPDLPENLLLLATTFVLAAASKRLVEDPIRFGARPRAARPSRILALTAVGMAVVVAVAALPMWHGATAAAEQRAQAEASLRDPAQCRGAAALLEPGCAGRADDPHPIADVVPALAGLRDDTAGAFDCYDFDPGAGGEPVSCAFGSEAPGAVRVALHGDSHAAMLIPALREVADERGWRVETFVGQGCVWQEPASAACAERNARLESRLADGAYDVLLVTAVNSAERDAAAQAAVADRYAEAWRSAQEAGTRVVVLADNPRVPAAAQDCVATADVLTEATCAIPRADAALESDPLRATAASLDAPLVDLSDAYCTADACPMMLGGVLVYRDLHHITGSFSTTLGGYLAERVSAAIGVEPSPTPRRSR